MADCYQTFYSSTFLLAIVLIAQTIGNQSSIDGERKLLDSEIEIQNGQEISSVPFEELLNSSKVGTNSSDIQDVPYKEEKEAEEQVVITHCQLYNHTGDSCEPCHDSIILWTQTLAGEEALEPCPTDETLPPLPGYAKRQCYDNGSWAYIADYSVCIALLKEQLNKDVAEQERKERELAVLTNSVYVFLAGFVVSNLAMITAIIIFARYKHLRCLRNLIHTQLLLGMTIKNFLWMVLMIETLQDLTIFDTPTRCKIFFMVYKFFLVSQYTWMFIEGLYLFIVVVNALFTNLLRFKHCLIIGWGIPVIVTGASAVINSFLSEDKCWNVGELTPANAVEIVSVCLLLLANCVFMVVVIYTLVRKLRNSALNESKQYGKAVRATMILVPLLGGTYIMLFYSFEGVKTTSAFWYYFNAFVQSTQGFIVALVYCFLNAEVRTSIAKSHRRWKDEKTLPSSDWWSRKRRSSYFITRSKEDTTETDATACQYSSGRNSRRVSEDTVSSSRRGSHVPDLTADITTNKHSRKASPLSYQQQQIVETHTVCMQSTEQTTLTQDTRSHADHCIV